MDLDQPTSGKILFDGKDITKAPSNERYCGVMFESYGLFPHLTILDNVGYARHVQGKDHAETHAMAREVLRLVRLTNRDMALPKECSGGNAATGSACASFDGNRDRWTLDFG